MSDRLRHAIHLASLREEAELLAPMLVSLAPLEWEESAIYNQAALWTKTMRDNASASAVAAFMSAYGLETREGVAMLCLAEALLRIPDRHTANALIDAMLASGEWDKHLGKSESLFVDASRWGLMLTGKVLSLDEHIGEALGGLMKRLSAPVIREVLRQAMRLLGSAFVLGEDIDEAVNNAAPYMEQGYRFSYDILGEGARNAAQAEAYMQAYRHAIPLLGAHAKGASLYDAPGISVKLSGLHPRYQWVKRTRVMEELVPRLLELLTLAKKAGITVALDAEEAARLDMELTLFEAIVREPALSDWNGLGFVVQAYQKRALPVIDYLATLAREHKRVIPLRLVKGAYWDSEIKTAQQLGLGHYPVFTRKEHTDVSYLACAQKILAARGCFFPQFATHNARTAASVFALAKQESVSLKDMEFQRLHGMGEPLHDQLLKHVPCRIYAPVGKHKDLLPYLIRRMLENGANTSFVHRLLEKDAPLEALLVDPVQLVRGHVCTPNPYIPLPERLFGARQNSYGIDFGAKAEVERLSQDMASCESLLWHAQPTVSNIELQTLADRDILSPATLERVGGVWEANEIVARAAVTEAADAWGTWAHTPVETRAIILENMAAYLGHHTLHLLSLLTREAGRTIPDAVNEIREAIDFCRYYAAEARKLHTAKTLPGPTGERNVYHLHPRGVFVCISPWNFPLSIFVGQVSAALVTGNAVVAKPAEQTPLVAAYAVEWFHKAGVPPEVLQFVTGAGDVGASLVDDPRIAGVVFTGSNTVASHINRALASRAGAIVPLIAETGGQNAMVVDSSALLEQACDDILLSAFGSAGQRCSSLRVLFVQEEVADDLLALLSGAMQELTLGDPANMATDIGPVIDADAKSNLDKHIARMTKEARLVATIPAPNKGHFVAPHLFEIERIEQISGEVFGPVLHVIRFAADALEQVVGAINSTGYGLTFGIHSRVQPTIDFFLSRVQAGNLYVNRSMIGAVVGSQPFGGEGLSGTGPKAGGPMYLTRFVTERVISTNTAAIGGNVSLLAGDEGSV